MAAMPEGKEIVLGVFKESTSWASSSRPRKGLQFRHVE